MYTGLTIRLVITLSLIPVLIVIATILDILSERDK